MLQYNSEKLLLMKEYNLHKHNIIAFQETLSNDRLIQKFAKNSLPDKNLLYTNSPDNKNASLVLFYDKKFTLIESSILIPGRILKAHFMIDNNHRCSPS